MIEPTPHIEYVDRGSGPVLVLLHGLGGNLHSWLANIPTLSAQNRIIALDLPGFGRSDPLACGVTMASYADATIGLLDRLGIERATFVGNSMGGLLTIEAAARHPDRVAAALLVCSGGIPLTTWRHRTVILPVGRALNRALRYRPVRHNVLRHSITRHALASGILYDTSRVDASRLIPALDGLGARNFGPTLRAALRYDARTSAPSVRCPTLILWGRYDRLLPLRMGARLHELIAGSELVVWDDAGHCPMIEHPQRFDALVGDFLNGR
jgi:pimeloyl-ACP methyl ester carboxylesterase